MSKKKEGDEHCTCSFLCVIIEHYFLTLFRSLEEFHVHAEDIVSDTDYLRNCFTS